ncbi:50S ribosomal protein L25 [Candidatus Peregrinibacteria bacterium]|nr:50S ribosomal protein L25 [Candidatus Peregrinibacteria bacterium]
MDMIPLQAIVRDGSSKVKKMRSDGLVPCVVYGHAVKNMALQCDVRALHKAFQKAGESTLVELELGGKKVPVLFKDIDFDPVSGIEIHADFYAVNMAEEIETLVPIHFEGEPPAVKTLAGIFVVTHDQVRVRCLPKDLPHALTVDVTKLENFHDSVAIKDIQVPAGVKVMETMETVLATVQEPRKEEEVIAATTVAAPAEGEAAVAGAPGAIAEAGNEGAPAAAGAPGSEAAVPSAGKEKKEKGGKEKK